MYPPPVPHRTGGKVPAGTAKTGKTNPTHNEPTTVGLAPSGRDRPDHGRPTPVEALPDIDLPLSFSVETPSTTSRQPKPLTLDSRPPSFEHDLAADGTGNGRRSPIGYVGPAAAPETDRTNLAQALTDQNPADQRLNLQPAEVRTGSRIIDDAADDDLQTLSPRFEFAPDFERPAQRSLTRRLAQGGLLVAAVAAVTGFIVMMPDDESTSVESAQDATQVRAEDNPTASAEMLTSSDSPSVEGQLGDTGELAAATPFSAAGIGAPVGTGDGFDLAVNDGLTDDDEPEPTTTTTVWVEPTLPPESEWVDSGNGVLVPDLQLRIRFCESTNNYTAANGHSTARGAYQFLTGSWDYYGHAAITGVTQAHLATPAQQDEAALRTLQSEGTGPWTASRHCWADENISPEYATAKPPSTPTDTTAPEDAETTTTTTGDDSTDTTVNEGEETTTTTGGESTNTTANESEETTTTTGGESTNTTANESEETTTTTTTTGGGESGGDSGSGGETGSGGESGGDSGSGGESGS